MSAEPQAVTSPAPKAEIGDRVVVHGHHLGEPERDGEILDVLGHAGSPPYLVRWEDGRVTRFYPSSDARVQHFSEGSGSRHAAQPVANTDAERPGRRDDRPPEPKGGSVTATETTGPRIVPQSVEKMHAWLNDVAEAMGTEDREYAYHALRAVLHTLRDRLPVNEAAQLASQLPTMVRGVFYEGWKPSRAPLTYRDVDALLERVGADMGAAETQASFAVAAVSKVLAERVSPGELEDVRAALPADLRKLFEA